MLIFCSSSTLSPSPMFYLGDRPLTCPSALVAMTASNTSSPSTCPPKSLPPHSSAIRRTTPLTRRINSQRHLSFELQDSTTVTMTEMSIAFMRLIDQGHLHCSLIQGLNLQRLGKKDLKASTMTENSLPSSLWPFRPPTPILMQQSTTSTSNSLQQQQQQTKKKKKKKKRKKKPQLSNLPPPKPFPSSQLPIKGPLPMATSSPMYASDLPFSTSTYTPTRYIYRVCLMKWTSLLPLASAEPTAFVAALLQLPSCLPKHLTMGHWLNPLTGAIVMSILMLVGYFLISLAFISLSLCLRSSPKSAIWSNYSI